MIAGKGIRSTLNEKLFIHPRPVDPAAYKKAESHLFPGIEEFRYFLDSTQSEELVGSAKKILLRLVHHHRVSPPASLVTNLLNYERQRQAKGRATSQGYIGQDHFVHLVNLYLLGIYLFAYHVELHARCSSQLNRLKRSFRERERAKGEGETLPYTSYELFGTVWASFVLFHDLAYPVEGIPAQSRAEHSEFLKPFSEIINDALTDFSLKAISNLLVGYATAVSDLNYTLNDLFLSSCSFFYPHDESSLDDEESINLNLKHGGGKSALSVVKKVWGGGRYLPKLHGHRFKATLSFLPDKDVCAVLEDQTTGLPLIAILGRQKGAPIIWLEEPNERPAKLKRASERSLRDSAFGAQAPIGSNFVWQYFGRGLDGFMKELLAKLFGENVDSFARLAERFVSTADISPTTLNALSSGGDASFRCFLELRGLYERASVEGLPAGDLENLLNAVEGSLVSISLEMPRLLGLAVEEFFKSEGFDLIGALENPSLKAGLLSLLGKLDKKGREKIAASLDSKLGSRIKREVEYELASNSVRQSVGGAIEDCVGKNFIHAMSGFSGAIIGETFELRTIVAENDPSVAAISRRLKGLGLPDLSHLISLYRPDHGKKDGHRFVDHGLGAALICITMARLFERVFSVLADQNAEKNAASIFLRLALLVDSRATVDLYWFEANRLFEEAAIAVCLHNLYPEALGGGYKLRTKSTSEPIAYLAMLVDALQRWDREKQLNQAFSELPFSVYGNRFDIDIKDDAIIVSVWGRGINIKDEERKLRESLGSYLEGAEKLIKLRLMEA